MKKLFLFFFMISLAFSNVMAYDFITFAPSGQILYCNILDQNNHLVGLSFGNSKPTGDLVIPETIYCNGADWTVVEIMEEAFRESTITSVVIPNTVTTIGNRAFYLCTSLSGTVVIPNSVNTVGYHAFCRCDRLTEVVLPAKDVTYLYGCFMTTGLTGTLTLPEGLVTIGEEMFNNNDKLTHVVIPHTVTTISQNAFSDCNKLEEILIPNSVTTIYCNPFYCSEKIESVMVEEGNPIYYSVNNCVINQATNTLVIGCKNSVIPEGIEAIGPYAFGQCGLTEMPEIPLSVTTIGEHAFMSCDYKGSLVLPETVTNFGQEVFIFCRFSSITVPHTIDTIPYGMFILCQYIDKITIPETISHIGNLAFSGCTKLKEIYVYNPVPPTMNTKEYYHPFNRVSRSATVYVPTGCVEAYRNAPGWDEFENIVENNYCWDGTVADSYDGGNGTPENPYQIATAEQLALLAYQTNNDIGGDAYYVLTEDINLESCSGENIQWTSIGRHEYENNNHAFHYFTGHFDGCGYTINGLYQNIENGLDYFGGLFGYTDSAEIKNINMTNCSISGIGGYVGSVVGFASRTDVLNCTAYDSYIRTTGSYTYAGGIVGYAGTPIGVSQINEPAFRISNCRVESVIVESSLYAGGIVGCVNDESDNAQYHISNCSSDNSQYFHVKGMRVGGIVGGMNYCTVEGCVNNSIVYGTGTGYGGSLCVGGIVGSNLSGGVISNSYNRGSVVTDYCNAGGIVGFSMGDVHNVYNTGDVSAKESGAYLGNIVGFIQKGHPHNCYWLENGLPGEGYPGAPYMMISNSSSFQHGATTTNWVLNEAIYGTTDLIEALNLGSYENYTWHEDIGFSNNGYPVFTYNEPNYPLLGSEWYYEITNDNGSITYQYLEMASDTIINDQPIHILVRINTLYDKDKSEVITHEYIYEHNDKVYWWNKTLGEFTTLYDFGANEGDEWEIKVGNESITMHVDAVEQYEYEGKQLKMLCVRDEADIFSGHIACGIGHLTSFFPEKLMNKYAGYRVENIRCYWQNGELIYQNGNQNCDEIYEQHHFSVDEIYTENVFDIYPNPSYNVLFVLSDNINSEYRITNILGETVISGSIASENQQINVSSLLEGIYFISIGNATMKFLKR